MKVQQYGSSAIWEQQHGVVKGLMAQFAQFRLRQFQSEAVPNS